MNRPTIITGMALGFPIAAFLLVEMTWAFSMGPPDGYAADPPDNNDCTQCHSTYGLNQGIGTLELTGLPESYTPDMTYQLAVTLTDIGQTRWGFELTAILETWNQGGELNPIDLYTQVSQGPGTERDYIKHTLAGTFNGQPTSATWNFEWAAPPPGYGHVWFYLTGNAADGNGGANGDYIYAISDIVPEGLLSPDTLYQEYFTDGNISMNWFDPWVEDDSIGTAYMPGNPSGDSWVGAVTNEFSGAGIGTALAGDQSMADYEVQAQIYCTVNTSTYHGIVARWDTTGGNSYYIVRCDFDVDQRLQLRKYPGLSGFGDTIVEWTSSEIPGGVPTVDSWHQMALKCEGDQLWVYWDGVEMSGCPYTDGQYTNGFFGVYVFNFMSTTSTYCDDIIVIGEAGTQPFDLIAQENHFLDQFGQPMILSPMENQTICFLLDWEAAFGSAISPPFDIALEIDDEPHFATTIPFVNPNTSHQTQSGFWTATLGEHTLRWTLDAENSVPESNEDNNILEETFLVLPEGAFDFQADSAWVANSDTIPYANPPYEGDEVLFVLFWSVPMGSGLSSPFMISMDLDSEEYYLIIIPWIEPGMQNMTVTPSWTAEGESHCYEWMIDPTNWVDEFNENNNYISGQFDVNPPPLPPPLVTMEPQNPPIIIPAAGGSFTFTAGLTNMATHTLQTDFWIMMDFPNGIPYGPLLLRRNLSLPAGITISRILAQQIPESAPSGIYYYYGNAGIYPDSISATEGFNFTKEAGPLIGGAFDDWSISGWEIPEIGGMGYRQIPQSFNSFAFPNPFNPFTTIIFTLPVASLVNLAIYDISGRLVTTLVNGWRNAGAHDVMFDGSGLASGIYLYRLKAGDFTASGKMVLVK